MKVRHQLYRELQNISEKNDQSELIPSVLETLAQKEEEKPSADEKMETAGKEEKESKVGDNAEGRRTEKRSLR